MSDTKHFLTSKILISSCVGLISTITMAALRYYGYEVVIDAETQLNITGALFVLIGYCRTRETKKLHAKAVKNDLSS